MSDTPTWLIVVIVFLGTYTVGLFAMYAYTRNIFMGALWPMTLLWMLFGNVQ